MILKEKIHMKHIKALKTMVGIAAAAAVFYGIVQVLNYMYVNSDDSWFQRLVLHDFYEDKGQIDNLCLGSSHVHCGINPGYLDKINGQFNFNLATPGQLPNGTFYFLREADRYNELSHVYVDLYYSYYVQMLESGGERIHLGGISSIWRDCDYMKLSANKLAYMFSAARPKEYINICIPFSRYRI